MFRYLGSVGSKASTINLSTLGATVGEHVIVAVSFTGTSSVGNTVAILPYGDWTIVGQQTSQETGGWQNPGLALLHKVVTSADLTAGSQIFCSYSATPTYGSVHAYASPDADREWSVQFTHGAIEPTDAPILGADADSLTALVVNTNMQGAHDTVTLTATGTNVTTLIGQITQYIQQLAFTQDPPLDATYTIVESSTSWQAGYVTAHLIGKLPPPPPDVRPRKIRRNGEWIADDTATKAEAMGVVVHGADANVARPDGYARVTWYGSVQPANAAPYDIYEYEETSG